MTDVQQAPEAVSVADLTAAIADFMPYLDRNLGAASKEHLNGELNNGALQYVLSRHSLAVAMITSTLSLDPAKVPAYFAYCAQLTIDMETAARDFPECKPLLDRWLDLYRRAGFTERHKFFDFPVMPDPEEPEEANKG